MANKTREGSPGSPPEKSHGRVHELLANDPRVREWHAEKSLKSRLSADTYTRMLCLISERVGMTPEEIVTTAKKSPDKLRVRFAECASALKKDGWLDTSVAKGVLMVKAYLKYRHVSTDVFPPLSSTTGETIQNERVPTQEELGTVLDKLSLRGRVVALFMAHSGVRPQVVGSYQGESGLRLRDLPDLQLGGKTLSFNETPFVIRVPANLSKTRTAYTTFGTSQQATALLAYMSERRDSGEKLGPDSPVVAAQPTRGAARMRRENASFANGFLSTSVLMREIHQVLTSSLPEGVRWRPYVLRSYCSTRLMMAEGAGKMTRDLREAILGHDTGVSGRYNVGKPWGTEVLKEARAQYKRAEPYLLTTVKAEEGNENATRVIRLLLEARGLSKEVLDKHDIGSMSDEEIVALIKTVGASPGTEKKTQKAVPVEEVPKLLEEGWEYIAALDGSRAVLKAP